MLAAVASLEKTSAGLTFAFTAATVVFFIIGAGLGWGFWRAAIGWINSQAETVAANSSARKSRRQFAVWTALILLAGLVCFLFPLKFVLEGKRREVFEGFSMAVAVLSFVGVLIWRVIRAFERDWK